jgi:hypothetical protein
MSNLLSLTPTQLRLAANLKEKLASANKELALIFGATSPAAVRSPGKPKGMSAAGRARIAAAQKARWSKVKAAKSVSVTTGAKVPVKKGTMSAAAKAKLSASAKARWTKRKAAGKKSL